MMRTFLYLPSLVADELALFRKHVPRGYDVRLDHGRRNDSDVDVDRRLMADTREDSDIWFAVDDPMQVYEKGDVLERL